MLPSFANQPSTRKGTCAVYCSKVLLAGAVIGVLSSDSLILFNGGGGGVFQVRLMSFLSAVSASDKGGGGPGIG